MQGAQVPFQFKFGVCNGLTNQKIQLLDGALAGLFLGAQIVLPKTIMMNGAQFVSVTDQNMQPLDHLFNMTRFETEMQQLYSDFWCRHKQFRACKIWCSDTPPAAITYDEAPEATKAATKIVDVELKPKDWAANGLTQVGEVAFKHIFDEKPQNSSKVRILRITVPCEFWFQLKVVEGDAFWEEFWKINDAFEFNNEILRVSKTAKDALLTNFGVIAQEKARQFGYRFDRGLIQHGGYHVVHLRAEKDWHAHCKVWFSWSGKRDNCMNNTFSIGNVLLSEGISPTLPVYLATGLSELEIQLLRNLPSMQNFFNIYTVVTKSMLGLPSDVGNKREYWAAVDYMFSKNADWFVGNSISTFSALTMEVRARQRMPVLAYNGGMMALEMINCIRSNILTMIPPMRPAEIKWVFTLPWNIEQNDLAYNMTMAAVKSAAAKAGLIPVCVTADNPNSTVLVKLVSMGVRVIYHRPTWVESAEQFLEKKISEQSDVVPSASQFDALMAQWLRIDIPVLGLLDEFVLYTDIDVLFLNDISWKDLLGKNHLSLRASLFRKMLGKGFLHEYATTGRVGIPQFLGVADRWGSTVGFNRDPDDGSDCGVMLMNLRSLRESHEQFRRFVLHKQWKQLMRLADKHGSDPCFYDGFYQRSSLPARLVWKPQRIQMASLVHFEGVNCHADIAPYVRNGGGRTHSYRQRVEECFDLEFCWSSYLEFCSEYYSYVP
eukprot:s332_g11.t1